MIAVLYPFLLSTEDVIFGNIEDNFSFFNIHV
jgi:hypothetical protein